VIGHDIDDHLDVGGVQRADHRIEVGQRAEPRINVAMIIDVIAAVGQCGGIERAHPDGVHAKGSQVRDPRSNASQIPEAITVAVGKAAWVDLVDHRRTPEVGNVLGWRWMILANRAHHLTSVPYSMSDFVCFLSTSC
jgi:hypothetical protein